MDAFLRSPTAIAIRSWQDAYRALAPLAEVFAATAALLVAATLVAGLPAVEHFVQVSPYHSWFAEILLDICRAFFITPLLIAVCRYVLLGEEDHVYRFVGLDRRGLIFLVFLNFLLLSQAAMGALAGAVNSLAAAMNGLLPALVSATLLPALAVFIVFVQVRLILLIPALAIDGDEAGACAAATCASDRFWTIFQTVALTCAPLAVAVLGVILWSETGHGVGLKPALAPLCAFFSPFWLAVGAAMTSRLLGMHPLAQASGKRGAQK